MLFQRLSLLFQAPSAQDSMSIRDAIGHQTAWGRIFLHKDLHTGNRLKQPHRHRAQASFSRHSGITHSPNNAFPVCIQAQSGRHLQNNASSSSNQLIHKQLCIRLLQDRKQSTPNTPPQFHSPISEKRFIFGSFLCENRPFRIQHSYSSLNGNSRIVLFVKISLKIIFPYTSLPHLPIALTKERKQFHQLTFDILTLKIRIF